MARCSSTRISLFQSPVKIPDALSYDLSPVEDLQCSLYIPIRESLIGKVKADAAVPITLNWAVIP